MMIEKNALLLALGCLLSWQRLAFSADLEIENLTSAKQTTEVTFSALVKYKGKSVAAAKLGVEFSGRTTTCPWHEQQYLVQVYADQLADAQPYTLTAEYRGLRSIIHGFVDVDAAELSIQVESSLDSAARIALRDLDQAKTVKCGCLTVQPQAIGGAYDGVWLTDSGECYEALRYWADNDYVRDYLYKDQEGEKGLIAFFSRYQENGGAYAGNLAEAIYGDPQHHWDKDRTIDYGGAFDLAYKPRKNHRDLGNSVYIFCNHWYWQDFADTRFIVQYYEVMKKFLQYHLSRQDKETGLIKSSYMIDHCDVCIDHASPNSCAIFTVNALLCIAMQQFSEMAVAIGKSDDASVYCKKAADLRHAINTQLWNQDHRRYEIKIFSNVTTDTTSPAFGISQEHYFFPASHGRFLDDWGNTGWLIPESSERASQIIQSIEEAQKGIRIYSPMVFPAYPDGWHNKILNGGRYCNGDCWTQFGSRYLGALFHWGYPKIALHGLRNLAAVAIRDNCFYEYYENSAEGEGKGVSKNNWASARYLHALVKGLFGLQADYPNHILYIHPSLSQSARIKCRLGKHGVEMDMQVDRPRNLLQLCVKTSYSGPADFRLLIDDAASGCKIVKNNRNTLSGKMVEIGRAYYLTFMDNLKAGMNSYEVVVKQR